jgi:hypothetical protein
MGAHDNGLQQQYNEIRSALAANYPSLANEDYKRWYPLKDDAPARTAYFRYNHSNILEHGVCKGSEHLQDLLQTTRDASAHQTSRALLIMEGVSATFRNLLVVKFGVDPQVFHKHARIAMWEASHRNAGNGPCLPSLLDASNAFSLDFCQLVHLNLADQQFTLRCLGNERHIASSRLYGKLDGIGAVSRKVTFWGKVLPNDGWIGREHSLL